MSPSPARHPSASGSDDESSPGMFSMIRNNCSTDQRMSSMIRNDCSTDQKMSSLNQRIPKRIFNNPLVRDLDFSISNDLITRDIKTIQYPSLPPGHDREPSAGSHQAQQHQERITLPTHTDPSPPVTPVPSPARSPSPQSQTTDLLKLAASQPQTKEAKALLQKSKKLAKIQAEMNKKQKALEEAMAAALNAESNFRQSQVSPTEQTSSGTSPQDHPPTDDNLPSAQGDTPVSSHTRSKHQKKKKKSRRKNSDLQELVPPPPTEQSVAQDIRDNTPNTDPSNTGAAPHDDGIDSRVVAMMNEQHAKDTDGEPMDDAESVTDLSPSKKK